MSGFLVQVIQVIQVIQGSAVILRLGFVSAMMRDSSNPSNSSDFDHSRCAELKRLRYLRYEGMACGFHSATSIYQQHRSSIEAA